MKRVLLSLGVAAVLAAVDVPTAAMAQGDGGSTPRASAPAAPRGGGGAGPAARGGAGARAVAPRGDGGFVAPRGGGGQNFGARGRGRYGSGQRHFRQFGGPVFGFGQVVPYSYYGAPYDSDAGDAYAPDEEDCYLVRRRVRTPSGVRYRRVYVCD
jgi:hypothetical protein